MLTGRRSDFIPKLQRACSIWKRQDAMLGLSLNRIPNMLNIVLEIVGESETDIRDTQSGYPQHEWYSDEVLVSAYQQLRAKDASLRRKLLAYAEKHNQRAKATAEQQLKLTF